MLALLLLIAFALYLGLYHGIFGALAGVGSAIAGGLQSTGAGACTVLVGERGTRTFVHHGLSVGPAGNRAGG